MTVSQRHLKINDSCTVSRRPYENGREKKYLPEWLDARRQGRMAKHVEDAAGIDDHESNGETHGRQHDAKPRRDANQLDDPKVVFAFDGVEEGAGGEDPPGVTTQSASTLTKKKKKK
jgi:hypothetical protein